jgi:hypothetical protein
VKAPAPRLATGFAVAVLVLVWLSAHGRAFDAGLISDSWYLLEVAGRPLRQALTDPYLYHTIPVTNLFTWLQRQAFGLHEAPYQALNVLLVLVTGVVFHRFVVRLTGDAVTALLAAGLWLTSACLYDIVYWPLVGNFHSLAAVLALAALHAVLVDRPIRFAVLAMLAFLTYEPMLSTAPAGLSLAAFLRREPTPESFGARLRALRPWLVAAGLVVVLAGAIKLAVALEGGRVTQAPQNAGALLTRFELAAKSLLKLFTARAADPPVLAWLDLGLGRTSNVALWLAGFLAAGVWAGYRGATATRFALSWLAVHITLTAAATKLLSRHLFFPALAASLLLALLVRRGLVARGPLPKLAAGLVVATLVLGGQTDLLRADRAYERSTSIAREGHRLILEQARQGRRIEAVQWPPNFVVDGLLAQGFFTGVHERLVVADPSRDWPATVRFSHLWPGGHKTAPMGSRFLSLAELYAAAADPAIAVLLWDTREARLVDLQHAPPELRAPAAALSPEGVPGLPWRPGAPLWLELEAGRAFTWPFARPPGATWAVLTYRGRPGEAFRITAGETLVTRVVPPPEASRRPVRQAFPLPATGHELTLVADSRMHLVSLVLCPPPTAPETELDPSFVKQCSPSTLGPEPAP